jgi:hypothetical protein
MKNKYQETTDWREDAQAGISKLRIACDREFFPEFPGHRRFSVLQGRNCVMTS